MQSLTQKAVKELLCYDMKSGKLTWRFRSRGWFSSDREFIRWNGRYAGKEAFTSVNSGGYKTGCVLKFSTKAHRVIWLYMTGDWPARDIDHINGDTTDNRWQNLRAATRLENSKNQKNRSTNTSGVLGVSRESRSGMWKAQIQINGRRKNLGRFSTIEEAAAVRKDAERRHNYHPNHGR